MAGGFLSSLFTNYIASFLPGSNNVIGAICTLWSFAAFFAVYWCRKRISVARANGALEGVRMLPPLLLIGLSLVGLLGGSIWLVKILIPTEAKSEAQLPPAPDPDSIYQAGIIVGQVFGGRRALNDATRFTFVEITKSSQFNPSAPFQFQGLFMTVESIHSRVGLTSSRPQDGTIYTGVTARILDPSASFGLTVRNFEMEGGKRMIGIEGPPPAGSVFENLKAKNVEHGIDFLKEPPK